ncbi:MAG: DUF4136 domain-containing protein [Burkholderiales bacterium]|nr:DUF4136 domain-containing protein [Burkholderiales bacterium]
MKHFLSIAVATLALLLSGCATTFSSQVSVFHEWPAEMKDKSYIFERSASQANDPEYKSYEEQLRHRLQMLGFQEMAAGHTPALKVGMQYGSALSDIEYSFPWHPVIYDPFWRIHFSRAYYPRSGFYYPYYYPYYFGRPYGMWGMYEVTVRRYYLHQLEIAVTEMKSGKKLADIKVSSEQLSPEISNYMHYLIDSALQDFPGKNGSTRNVEVPLEK